MNVSLNGLRILNTRPRAQGELLSVHIKNAQGVSIELPTLEIKKSAHNWLATLPDLTTIDYALFVSANAVIFCFEALLAQGIFWPSSIHVIAIGQGTAHALARYHVLVNEIPLIPESESLLQLNSIKKIVNKNIVLFKGEGGRTLLEEFINTQKANLFLMSVYERTLPSIDPQFPHSLWRDDAVDIILLTSEHSIRNLFSVFSQEAHSWLRSKPCIVLSKRLADIASTLGITKIIISHPNQIIETLLDYKD